MSWPAAPLILEVGLRIGGAWVDAIDTGGVLVRDPISIKRGRSNWASRVDPAQARASIKNTDGRFSPDNPAGPYHGQLRRNTQLRVGRAGPAVYGEWDGTDGGYDVLYAPYHSSFNLTGSIDVRLGFRLRADLVDIVADGGNYARLTHFRSGANGWEMALYCVQGELVAFFAWATSGGVEKFYTTESTGAVLPYSMMHDPSGLRFTLNTATGAGTWYTSDAYDGTWTQLGAVDSSVGATSIGAVGTSTEMKLGGLPGDGLLAFPGELHGFQVRSGIGGTAVLDLDLTAQTPGDTSFTDGAGRTWNTGTDGRISDMTWRFHGEVASLPVRWTLDDRDLWVPIEAAGIFRRLRQGAKQLPSPLRRQSVNLAGLVQYWPMEETGGRGLRLFGAAVGDAPFIVQGGEPNPAQCALFLASDPIPELGSEVWTCQVDPYTETGEWQLRWLMYVDPASPPGDGIAFLAIQTTTLTVQVVYRNDSGGELRVLIYLLNGVLSYDSGYIGFAIDGQVARMSLSLVQDGADIDWELSAVEDTSTSPGGLAATATGLVAGAPVRIDFNPTGGFSGTAIGHVTLQSTVTDPIEQVEVLNAYAGETAGRRIQRLCLEEGIPYRIHGDPAETERMGPQRPGSFPDLLETCAATDLGILSEAPDSFAISYRTYASMQNQDGLTLDADGAQVEGVPDVDRDDQDFANDVTVTNWSKAQARAELTDGPLKVDPPPDGVGRYDTSLPVNVENDRRLLDHAYQRLALFTPDEPRLGRLATGTHLPGVDATLEAQLLAMRLGDLLVLDGLQPLAFTDDRRQIVQAVAERIDTYTHTLAVTGSPAAPWAPGLTDDADARYDTAGSSLASSATAGATSLSVNTDLGPRWITSFEGGEFPFYVVVDGVRIEVTAISGTSNPQTFAVTGADVVRNLASGVDVRLADPTLYTL